MASSSWDWKGANSERWSGRAMSRVHPIDSSDDWVDMRPKGIVTNSFVNPCAAGLGFPSNQNAKHITHLPSTGQNAAQRGQGGESLTMFSLRMRVRTVPASMQRVGSCRELYEKA